MTDPEVDQPYISAADLRAAVAPALDNETKYPDGALEDLIAEFQALVARELGVYLLTTTTEHAVVDRGPILLSHPRIYSVTSFAYVDGSGPTFVVADDLDYSSGWSIVRKEPSGQAWTVGRTVAVTYVHGYVDPPPGLMRACRLFVKNEAQAEKSAMPASASQVESDATGYGYQFDRIDPANGKYTRWPNVNAALAAVPVDRLPGMA